MVIIKSDNNIWFKDIIKYPTIEILENTMTFITGKSGCGKSSYLKMLNATEPPTGGNIYYKQTDIKTLDIIGYRKNVALVTQQPFLFEGTVLDNFESFYLMRKQDVPDIQTIKSFLKLCAIEMPLETVCDTLSVGEKQRLFLALFLSFEPKVLLLDEPTAALDYRTAVEVFSNIKEWIKRKNITVVVVCHSKKLTDEFSDNTIQLERKGEE